MKKIIGFLLSFLGCFIFICAVSASSNISLSYSEKYAVTVDQIGTDFTTQAIINGVSGTPTVKTQVGRKMFGLIWYDSGSITTAYANAGAVTTTSWHANGTYPTRSTWTNVTSGTSVTGIFSLY